MDTLLIDFLDKSRKCQTLEDLSTLVQQTFDKLGFHKWAYQTKLESFFKEAEPIIVHNFSKEWEDYYISNNCSDVDPVIVFGGDLSTPFQWSDLVQNRELTQEQKTYYHNAIDHGMADGLAIPIPSPLGYTSMVSMISDESSTETLKKFESKYDKLIAISCAYHSQARDFLKKQDISKDNRNPLTKRERECLLWTARGKTAWEISRITDIKERTVVFHIENAKRKLEVNSRYHAVVKAIMEGFITP